MDQGKSTSKKQVVNQLQHTIVEPVKISHEQRNISIQTADLHLGTSHPINEGVLGKMISLIFIHIHILGKM